MRTHPAFRLPLLSANQFEIVKVLTDHVNRFLDHISECYFLKLYFPVILFTTLSTTHSCLLDERLLECQNLVSVFILTDILRIAHYALRNTLKYIFNSILFSFMIVCSRCKPAYGCNV